MTPPRQCWQVYHERWNMHDKCWRHLKAPLHLHTQCLYLSMSISYIVWLTCDTYKHNTWFIVWQDNWKYLATFHKGFVKSFLKFGVYFNYKSNCQLVCWWFSWQQYTMATDISLHMVYIHVSLSRLLLNKLHTITSIYLHLCLIFFFKNIGLSYQWHYNWFIRMYIWGLKIPF